MLFIKKEKDLHEVPETTYDKEDQMQQYIYQNPQLLPVEEITGNKKLVILVRELSTEYGRLDGLGIDEAGNVYIIETKLLRNSDRRNIIAQLLDYGVALRTEYKDPQELLNYLTDKGVNTKELIIEKFWITEELADSVIENFKNNIKQGVYQFVAVTDAIEQRILDQIYFINQSSKFSFYLVDMKYYRHGKSEFIIPKAYGGGIIKTTNSWISFSSKSWNEIDFFDMLEINTDMEVKKNIQNITSAFAQKWYIVEYWQSKYPTVRIYDNKKDNFLVNIWSKTGEIILHKNSKFDTKKRIDFYNQVFKVDFNSTEKINYTLKYEDFKDKIESIISSLPSIK